MPFAIDKQLVHRQLDEIIARLEQENGHFGGSCWLELCPVRYNRNEGTEYRLNRSNPFEMESD